MSEHQRITRKNYNANQWFNFERPHQEIHTIQRKVELEHSANRDKLAEFLAKFGLVEVTSKSIQAKNRVRRIT